MSRAIRAPARNPAIEGPGGADQAVGEDCCTKICKRLVRRAVHCGKGRVAGLVWWVLLRTWTLRHRLYNANRLKSKVVTPIGHTCKHPRSILREEREATFCAVVVAKSRRSELQTRVVRPMKTCRVDKGGLVTCGN